MHNLASSSSAAQAVFKSPGEMHVSGVVCDEVATVNPARTDDMDGVHRFMEEMKLHGSLEGACHSPEEILSACIWALSEGSLQDRWINDFAVPSLLEARALFNKNSR
jgi:hypothetical protein